MYIISRKEQLAEKILLEQHKTLEEELDKIKQIDESHVTLLPHHQHRLEVFQKKMDEKECNHPSCLDATTSDKRQLRRQMRDEILFRTKRKEDRCKHLTPEDESEPKNTSIQQLNKLRGDILSSRNNQLHFNQVTYTEARAFTNVATKSNLKHSCSRHRSFVDGSNENRGWNVEFETNQSDEETDLREANLKYRHTVSFDIN